MLAEGAERSDWLDASSVQHRGGSPSHKLQAVGAIASGRRERGLPAARLPPQTASRCRHGWGPGVVRPELGPAWTHGDGGAPPPTASQEVGSFPS